MMKQQAEPEVRHRAGRRARPSSRRSRSALPRRTAAITPAGMPISDRDEHAEDRELERDRDARARSCARPASSRWSTPRSPCSASQIQCAYCTGSGRSSRYLWRIGGEHRRVAVLGAERDRRVAGDRTHAEEDEHARGNEHDEGGSHLAKEEAAHRPSVTTCTPRIATRRSVSGYSVDAGQLRLRRRRGSPGGRGRSAAGRRG